MNTMQTNILSWPLCMQSAPRLVVGPGTSSESDPWLLRHCQFDESGLRSFYGLQFRNIGGVPNRQKIPVHFILTPKHKDQAEGIGRETSLRHRLNSLIPVSWGICLIKL